MNAIDMQLTQLSLDKRALIPRPVIELVLEEIVLPIIRSEIVKQGGIMGFVAKIGLRRIEKVIIDWLAKA